MIRLPLLAIVGLLAFTPPSPLALAQDTPSPTTAPEAKPVPIENKPYAIEILLDFDPQSRFDSARRQAIISQWRDMAERFVGAPWAPQFSEDLGNLPAIPFDDLKADDLKPFAAKADKVWAIRFYQQGPDLDP